MEEKKPLKIKFKTAVILIVTAVVLLGIGANVYASVNGYGNIFFLIKYKITGQKQETITGKDNLLTDRDMDTAIKSNTNADSMSLSEKEIRESIQKFLNIRQILASDTLNILVELGLKSTNQLADDYSGFKSNKPYENSYFVVTDVDYSDFENAITKYMTMELFNNLYPSYIENKDGKLCIYSDGGTTGTRILKECDVKKITTNLYKCDIIVTCHNDDDGKEYSEKYAVMIIEEDGKYAVSELITGKDNLSENKTEGTTNSNENKENNNNTNIAEISAFESIENIASEWVEISKINNYKNFICDLDGDGIEDNITLRTSTDQLNNQRVYYVELNGKKVIDEEPITVSSMMYIVDLNKNDNSKEVVIEDSFVGDNPQYYVYSKKYSALTPIAYRGGWNLKTDQNGILVSQNWLTMDFTPSVYDKYYEIENGNAYLKNTDIEKIKNIIFKSENLFFTEDMNNLTKRAQKNDNSLEKADLEKNGIFKGEYEFNIIRFCNEYENCAYVRLTDGREGYLFTARGYLVG